MEQVKPEIPQVDLPDEITQVDFPEIGETTPHPLTPDQQAESGGVNRNDDADVVRADGKNTANEKSTIGFTP